MNDMLSAVVLYYRLSEVQHTLRQISMKRSAAVMVSAVLSPIIFFGLWFLRVVVLDPYLSLMLGLDTYTRFNNAFCVLSPLVLLTLLISCTVYQVLRLKVSVLLVRSEIFLYLILAFCIIMFKSNHVRGINLSLLDIANQFSEAPANLLLNVVLFIPLGCLFKRLFSKNWQAFAAISLIVVLIESSQWLFSLGIFDIIDVFTNLLGFSLGYLLWGLVADYGWTISREGKYYILRGANPSDASQKS